jgi:hypothetical protein
MLAALVLVLWGGDWFTYTNASELSFEYTAIGAQDEYDQVLTITNDGLGAVAPTLRITPLDAGGRPIAGLEVTSAFGSTRGTMIVPAFYEDWDILKFDGERADEVRDVLVEVERLEQVDYPDTPEGGVSVERHLNEGKPAEDFDDPFDAVELRNPNEEAETVKLALFAWRAKRGDAPQQFEWVITNGAPVTVPGKGRTLVELGPDTAGIRGVTVNAFRSTTS